MYILRYTAAEAFISSAGAGNHALYGRLERPLARQAARTAAVRRPSRFEMGNRTVALSDGGTLRRRTLKFFKTTGLKCGAQRRSWRLVTSLRQQKIQRVRIGNKVSRSETSGLKVPSVRPFKSGIDYPLRRPWLAAG